MVYHNQKVILIDFGILNDKHYSFYINQKLFQMSILAQNGNFAYDLKEHHTTPITPMSPLRRWKERILNFMGY